MLRRLWWLPVAAIFVLSVVPPSLRPVLGPHIVEHAAAFGLAASWYALSQRQPVWVMLVASTVFCCAIEGVQRFAPGRHARWLDLWVDILAAATGILAGAALSRAMKAGRP